MRIVWDGWVDFVRMSPGKDLFLFYIPNRVRQPGLPYPSRLTLLRLYYIEAILGRYLKVDMTEPT